MALYGEWTRKGATLSDTTARKEYGVDGDFIVKGVKAGKLEYRNGEMYESPYIKVRRRQLEGYIAQELGEEYLRDWKDKIAANTRDSGSRGPLSSAAPVGLDLAVAPESRRLQ